MIGLEEQRDFAARGCERLVLGHWNFTVDREAVDCEVAPVAHRLVVREVLRRDVSDRLYQLLAR